MEVTARICKEEKEPLLKIDHIDNGFCRVNYTAKNKANQKVFYCIQEGMDDLFIAYRSTTEWEPMNEVALDPEKWEVPKGNTHIEVGVRKFLNGLK